MLSDKNRTRGQADITDPLGLVMITSLKFLDDTARVTCSYTDGAVSGQ